MNTRIALIRKSAKLSQADFAKELNLSRTFVSLVETGDRQVSDRTILDICRIFNVNEDWLRDGTGDMKAPPSREQEIADMVSKLVKLDPNDEADQLMYDTLMHLKDVPKSGWEDFLQFIKEEIPKLNLK